MRSYGSGIYIHDAKEMQRYQKLLRGSNDFSTIRITVVDLLHPPMRRSTSGHVGPHAAAVQVGHEAPPGAAYVVLLDYSGSGEYVFLVEVDGELVPGGDRESWIS